MMAAFQQGLQGGAPRHQQQPQPQPPRYDLEPYPEEAGEEGPPVTHVVAPPPPAAQAHHNPFAMAQVSPPPAVVRVPAPTQAKPGCPPWVIVLVVGLAVLVLLVVIVFVMWNPLAALAGGHKQRRQRRRQQALEEEEEAAAEVEEEEGGAALVPRPRRPRRPQRTQPTQHHHDEAFWTNDADVNRFIQIKLRDGRTSPAAAKAWAVEEVRRQRAAAAPTRAQAPQMPSNEEMFRGFTYDSTDADADAAGDGDGGDDGLSSMGALPPLRSVPSPRLTLNADTQQLEVVQASGTSAGATRL